MKLLKIESDLFAGNTRYFISIFRPPNHFLTASNELLKAKKICITCVVIVAAAKDSQGVARGGRGSYGQSLRFYIITKTEDCKYV